jgi:glucosamine-6-phosphate deaminase
MDLEVLPDYTALSQRAADMFCDAVALKPDAVVVLATGDTPMEMYRLVAERVERGELELTQLRVCQLDAYVGLPRSDTRSLYGWLARSVLEPWGIQPHQVMVLRDDSPDPDAACQAYDEALRQLGRYDLSVLGLGPNGHLGFNEPPSEPDSPTRVVELTEESIESNARYWGAREQVPRRALTAGMRALLEARQTLLLVAGASKREILRRALEEPFRQLCANAGTDGAVMLAQIRRKQDEQKSNVWGYEVIKNEIVDLTKAGIIDPAKVVRSAVENAISIASMILTTEALVTDLPEKEKAPAMPPGGGMDY